MKLPFSVLVEDYNKSSKQFSDVKNCPLACAFRRQFPDIALEEVGLRFIYLPDNNTWSLDETFDLYDYLKLQEGEEFHTLIEVDEAAIPINK